METTNQKTNFWKEVWKSIKDLDKYEDFALEAPAKAMKYFAKLMKSIPMVYQLERSHIKMKKMRIQQEWL